MPTIKLKAEMENLGNFVSFIMDFASENNMNEGSLQKIELAVEEILVNIINYAYSQNKGDIEIKCENKDKCLQITIIDEGVPFDSVAAEDPDVTKSIDERDVGGLGIFLVKQMMDMVDYKRENNCNVLTLNKKY